MPRSPISLRDPRVVIAVAVLLLVVGAVNLQTFLPELTRGHGGEIAWDPDAFVPPVDTAELTQRAAGQVTGAGTTPPPSPAVAGAGLGSGLRDPFRTGSTATESPAEALSPAPGPAPTPQPEAVARGPVCSAVLFAGTRAAAVIDGETRQVGDAVGEWQVVAIGPDGVRLRGPRGEKLLAVGVGVGGDGAARYPLVTQPAAAAVGHSTALEPVSGSREP